MAQTSDEAWQVIDRSLQSGDSDHRQEALAALATIREKSPEAVRRAIKALDDKHTDVRRAAALTLGELKAQDAVPRLLAMLDDPPRVSLAAAEALTELGNDDGRNVLAAVLTGERKDAPGFLANAVHKAEDKLHHPESLLLMGTQDAAGAMFGPPAGIVIPAVKQAVSMKGRSAPGRLAAVAYLARYPNSDAIGLLEFALADAAESVRLEAAKELGERGNSRSMGKLEPLLVDGHNAVRDMAAVAIIRIAARGGAPGKVPAGPVPHDLSAPKK